MGCHNIAIDLPLGRGAETHGLRSVLGHMPFAAGPWVHELRICDDIAFVLASGEPEGVDRPDRNGIRIRNGRLTASLWMADDEVDAAEWIGGIEIQDGRPRGRLLMDALSRMTAARPGEIVGAIWSEDDGETERAGPIVMTQDGPRACLTARRPLRRSPVMRDATGQIDPLTRVPADLVLRDRSIHHSEEWIRMIDADTLRSLVAPLRQIGAARSTGMKTAVRTGPMAVHAATPAKAPPALRLIGGGG